MSLKKSLSLPLPILALAVLLSGCATGGTAAPTVYTPVVDTKDVDMVKYQQDMAECRTLADQVDVMQNTATSGLIGTGLGAAAGAAIGAIGGDPGTGAATGAALGALGGGGSGAMNALDRKKNILNNCLSGRGYKVLG